MGIEAIVATAIALAGIIGGFAGGRRTAGTAAMGIAVDTVDLLQVQVSALIQKNAQKDSMISELTARIEILESLVTQRAEVEAVHVDVREVRGVVDRIATRVGA